MMPPHPGPLDSGSKLRSTSSFPGVVPRWGEGIMEVDIIFMYPLPALVTSAGVLGVLYIRNKYVKSVTFNHSTMLGGVKGGMLGCG